MKQRRSCFLNWMRQGDYFINCVFEPCKPPELAQVADHETKFKEGLKDGLLHLSGTWDDSGPPRGNGG